MGWGPLARPWRAKGRPWPHLGAARAHLGAPRAHLGAPRCILGAPRRAFGEPRCALGAPRCGQGRAKGPQPNRQPNYWVSVLGCARRAARITLCALRACYARCAHDLMRASVAHARYAQCTVPPNRTPKDWVGDWVELHHKAHPDAPPRIAPPIRASGYIPRLV